MVRPDAEQMEPTAVHRTVAPSCDRPAHARPPQESAPVGVSKTRGRTQEGGIAAALTPPHCPLRIQTTSGLPTVCASAVLKPFDRWVARREAPGGLAVG
jgi:hypothetical protein